MFRLRTRLNTEAVRVLRQPDIEERLTARGGEAETNTPQQFAAHIKTGIKNWAGVIKAAGLKAEQMAGKRRAEVAVALSGERQPTAHWGADWDPGLSPI